MPFVNDFVRGLERVRGVGVELLKPLKTESQTLEGPKTEEAARASGVLAAVRALETAVAPLCAPGKAPTLAEGKQALHALKQLHDVQAAYADAYVRALAHVCWQLEDELDRQQEREAEPGNQQHNQ